MLSWRMAAAGYMIGIRLQNIGSGRMVVVAPRESANLIFQAQVQLPVTAKALSA